jgi:hypothetical protein
VIGSPLALLLLVAVDSQDEQRVAVMDQIEATIALPPRAHPLSDYARYYAFAGPNKVRAVYLIPFPPMNPEATCSISDGKGDRECTAAEIRRMHREDAKRIRSQLPAGGRIWFNNSHGLPLIMDGGCSVLDLEYDLASKHVLVACHGVG